ncbi:MAG: hypothetical protein AB1721_01470 [Patescibacteria group bacterium]
MLESRRQKIIFIAVIIFVILIALSVIYFVAIKKPADQRRRILYYSHPVYGYLIYLPLDWQGRYLVQETEDGVSFLYNSESATKHELFSIMVYDWQEWQTIKQSQFYHGRELAQKNNLVFVLTQTSGNSYSGREAEEFQAMASQISRVIDSFELN